MDDAVVVGSGPNGLAAAIELARAGASVRVLEARDEIGGGTRTAALTLPGFAHDVCSGCHPMGVLSPFFRSLPLERARAALDSPARVGRAPARRRAGRAAAALARRDRARARRGRRRLRAALRAVPARAARAARRSARRRCACRAPDPHGALRPARACCPRRSLLRARFRGRARARAARRLRGALDPAARAAAHRGGRDDLRAHRPRRGLAGRRGRLAGDRRGARVVSARRSAAASRPGDRVRSLADLPPARVVLFDTSPAQLADVGEPILPAGYVRRLRRYRYGPGVFKLDWALDGPIPWRDPRCLEASTVHLGGTLDEIAAAEAAVWRGEHPERPFVLVVQQSQFDPDARAGRQAHRLRLLSRPGRIDRRSDRRRSSSRSSASRPASATASWRATCMRTADLERRESQLRRRRDHRRRRRSVPVLHAAGGAARSVLHAESAPLHLLGVDAAGRRRARHVRLLRGAERAAQAGREPPIPNLRSCY